MLSRIWTQLDYGRGMCHIREGALMQHFRKLEDALSFGTFHNVAFGRTVIAHFLSFCVSYICEINEKFITVVCKTDTMYCYGRLHTRFNEYDLGTPSPLPIRFKSHLSKTVLPAGVFELKLLKYVAMCRSICIHKSPSSLKIKSTQ